MIWEGLLLLYRQRIRLVGFSTLLKFLLTDFRILCVKVVKVFFQAPVKIELTLWWSVTMKAMAIMMTAATVMKAITTMNNCYTGHDSYLLEWEGYISKVLINYEFFFQDLKENLDNLKDIQSQLEQNIPHVWSIISENIFGMTLNAYIHWSVSHSCQFVYLHIFSIFFCCSVTGWFLCKSVFIVQPEG